MTFNYKKNKLEQLKGFCATVECGNSINDAAIKSFISATTISKQISSLEQDLGFRLFDRIKNKLVLNDKGKVYYQEVKRVLFDLDKIYGGKIGIRNPSMINIFYKRLKIKIQIYIHNYIKKITMIIIKITLLRFIGFIGLLLLGLFVYLHQTNWFFDKKLEKLANPLLREVMSVGYHRIPKVLCPFTTYQFFRDLYDLMQSIINDQTIQITEIGLYDCPSTTMRMNGTDDNDNKFYDSKFITCDIDRRFKANQYEYKIESNLLKHINFSVYSLYRKTNCINHNTFIQNSSKYRNLFGIEIKDKLQLSNAAMFIIKKNNYYYLISETNGKQPGVDLHHQEERYLIFKKLTPSELMHYDNGSYWKLIKSYNIKID